MKRVLPYLACAVSALLALGSGAALTVAGQTLAQAEEAVDGAERLRRARLDLVDAQADVGESDLESALSGAEKANEAALGVKDSTFELLDRLSVVAADVQAIDSASKRLATRLDATRSRTRAAAALLELVRSDQVAAADATAYANRFLRRILASLRDTNRSFP